MPATPPKRASRSASCRPDEPLDGNPVSELLTYIHLGFHHIASPGALDHILFLLALAAVYRPHDWRESLWVLTAFTLGHSLTLALVVTRVVTLPSRWIEFLIPVTILLTCAGNLLSARNGIPSPGRRRAVYAVLFGLVHGAGFADYLRSMFLDHIVVPLLGFNLGIEAGQIVVLAVAATVLWGGDLVLGSIADSRHGAGFRRRVVLVSLVAGVMASGMALERLPF
jgi:HupE / UreJ protein